MRQHDPEGLRHHLPALRLLGRSGSEVVTRVLATILTALGVQFVLDGLRPVALEILGRIR